MKKFLLLFVMLSGMLMQHELLADTYTADGVEIVVNGKTVTINATNAGALSAYLNSGQASAAIAAIQAANGDGSSIVFDGNFNQSDLQALSTNNCCVQKKVDMYEAKFIASTSSLIPVPFLALVRIISSLLNPKVSTSSFVTTTCKGICVIPFK